MADWRSAAAATVISCATEMAEIGASARIAINARVRTFMRSLLPSYNDEMPISARNKLPGKIEDVQLGNIMAHVVVRVGDNLIESAITRRSAEELKLKKGDTVTAIVKATEVIIQKD
jgi:molybdopterin-binding protein